MRVDVEARTLRFREPLRTAFAELTERTVLELTLTDDDGVTGRGEASPLEPYDGVPLAVALVRLVRRHADGPTLNEALARTGLVQLLFCALLSAGVLLA